MPHHGISGSDSKVIAIGNLRRRDARDAERAQAFVFSDPQSAALMVLIERIAPSDATILIHGETGTGKEVVAQHIHRLSKRAAKPMLAINCGAISPTLIEAELFGYEKGAFTGAVGSQPGWFEAANGGTLFLDEIGELPMAMQGKLLRVLQEREVVRIGSRRPIPLDVRLIAATNQDLMLAIREKRFRDDLYYRLRVVAIDLSPLRDRPGDIVPLARFFAQKFAAAEGRPAPDISTEAEALLLGHHWRGNIRELENVINRATLVMPGERIEAADLLLTPLELKSGDGAAVSGEAENADGAPKSSAKWNPEGLHPLLREAFEQQNEAILDTLIDTAVEEAWRYSSRSQAGTARVLGVTRNVARTFLRNAGLLLRGRTPGERSVGTPES